MNHKPDAKQIAAQAEQAATHAKAALDSPAVQAAFARLEQHYLAAIRGSEPRDTQGRETSFFMLRALDAVKQDIEAAASGAAIAQRNLRSRLKR